MKLDYLYGTAWKEDLTSECVFNAIEAGYRAIDTANQKKHYNEPGVGEGLQKAYSKLGVTRNDLFLQTKFTYASGQDHRKPYNENDPYAKQVRSSFDSSLKHLNTDYLDSLVLHGPFSSNGISAEDKEVWTEMENLYQEDGVKALGVSNLSLSQLEELYNFATVKPKHVQIRCFASNQWEKEHREFCKKHEITFQGFSLLTANRDYIGGNYIELDGRNVPQLNFKKNEGQSSAFDEIVASTGKAPGQIIFQFCHQIGILPITGTRSIENMKLNLELNDFELSDSQIEKIENIAFN